MDMRKAWYPLTTSKKLGRNNVLAVELFGEPLALFRNQTGKPVCLQDRCPHRSVPLSRGRVEDGRIECRYHGWQFGDQGRCIRIPSQRSEVRISERANAQYRACIELRDHVFVWADAPETADLNVMSDGPFEIFAEAGMYYYTYDATIETAHELVVENLLDPAHIPFTHHGTLSRRSFAQPIRFEDIEDTHALFAAQSVFEPPTGAPVPPIERVVFKFYFPCIVTLDLWGKPRGSSVTRTYQLHYCVPLSESRMGLFSFYGASFLKPLRGILKPLFRALAARALRQDIDVLHAQQGAFARGAPAYGQAVSSDRLNLRYRKWLDEHLTKSIWFSAPYGVARRTTSEVAGEIRAPI
jgi:nitrite reductase/ring-hydroxylating ferredoxin subunit